jgi:hypothetical protein
LLRLPRAKGFREEARLSRYRSKRCGVTRRALLAAGLGLAALPVQAEEPAQNPDKTTQAQAEYQNTPKGMFSCANCTFFIKPRSCKVVSGDIDPKGWCKLFDLAD